MIEERIRTQEEKIGVLRGYIEDMKKERRTWIEFAEDMRRRMEYWAGQAESHAKRYDEILCDLASQLSDELDDLEEMTEILDYQDKQENEGVSREYDRMRM